MPYLTVAGAHVLHDKNGHLPGEPVEGCVVCDAEANLDADCWQAIRYFRLVCDCYRNQTPMGVEGGEPVLTPVYADWKAVLEIREDDFPRSDWPRLFEDARLLFDGVHERRKFKRRDHEDVEEPEFPEER